MDYKTARNELAKEIAATLTLLASSTYILTSITESTGDLLLATILTNLAGVWLLVRAWDAYRAIVEGALLYVVMPEAECKHQYHFFGDQPVRRCNICNALEPVREDGDMLPLLQNIPTGKRTCYAVLHKAMRLQGEYAFRASMSEELQARYDAIPPEEHFAAALRETLALYYEGRLHE